jgi:predicted GNAT family acetyltransferase
MIYRPVSRRGLPHRRKSHDNILTEVPLPLRGRGYGYHLVCCALQEVRRLNLKVEPDCGFVREVIQQQFDRRTRGMTSIGRKQ